MRPADDSPARRCTRSRSPVCQRNAWFDWSAWSVRCFRTLGFVREQMRDLTLRPASKPPRPCRLCSRRHAIAVHEDVSLHDFAAHDYLRDLKWAWLVRKRPFPPPAQVLRQEENLRHISLHATYFPPRLSLAEVKCIVGRLAFPRRRKSWRVHKRFKNGGASFAVPGCWNSC